jgi:hypothetical protein
LDAGFKEDFMEEWPEKFRPGWDDDNPDQPVEEWLGHA